jgi:RND family efflux transporter MFP subunit
MRHHLQAGSMIGRAQPAAAPASGRRIAACCLALAALGLSGCQQREADKPAEVPARSVRTVTVEAPRPAADLSFTGLIEAQDQVTLGFRLAGRVEERLVGIGASVAAGDVIARLDPTNELNELRAARAALAAAEGALRKADNQHQRNSHLRARGITSQADFEAGEQGLVAARAQVEAAQARVHSAEEIVAFTTIKADAPGIVTHVGAEPSEVVAAGQMIVRIARRDGRDAVFAVPAEAIRTIPPYARIEVSLAGEGGTGAAGASPAGAMVRGQVREVSPQADPVTRTFRVRVGLSDPPPAFRLGASVNGAVRGADMAGIAVPAMALAKEGGQAGVWVVDPSRRTVSLRKIDILSSDAAKILVGKGLSPGDIVVTAGANLLKEGQRVRLSGTETP